jgi:thiosulfate reductase/polysulfide reductase chain A
MDPVSRRRFLKISAGATAATAAAGLLPGAPGWAQFLGPAKRGDRIETVPTVCDLCFWKCAAIATTKNGQLWKIEGNPADPLSRGRLCPRGTGGVGAYYDADRLRTPLMRRQKRGEDEWTAVTWGEALGTIAERMQKAKAQYGPEAVAFFSHGIGGNFLKHTFKAFGTPNMVAPSYAQCRGPRDVGFQLTFGEDVGTPERTDIANARCLVLIGSHLGENMHNSQVQEFAEAIGAGATVIVADPRFSVAAGKAKHYLPVKPGTDLALVLAWMNVLVEEGLYDRDFVAAHGYGFDAFRASIVANTPEWAYPITTLHPDLIRETAREMAAYRPATLVHPGRHVTWYGDDTQRSRAIALLNALLGNWGRRGGFYFPSSYDIPKYPYPPYPHSERGPADNPNGRYPFADLGLTNGIREATLTGQPYPIKNWFVYATNLLQALPNQDETIRAIQRLDFLAVVDVVPSQMAGWADVVLPEAVYLERYDDLNTEAFREPFVSLRQPVVEPPDDQKPNWWIARQLAQKLGLESYYPWQNVEEYLDARLVKAGLSLARLKREGVVVGAHRPINVEEGHTLEFGTPSGKVEFYSPQLAEKGFEPVPRYSAHAEPPPGSFRLLFGRSPVHTFSRTQTNPLLHEAMPENEVWVHADVARRLGLANGQRVRLTNQDGVTSAPLPVKATERMRTDCVYLVHGFGHTAKGLKRALGKGASDAQLVTRYVVDPLMGGTAMNVNFVTLSPEA